MDESFYGDKFSYIHLKFGDMRKMYFFTDEFRAKHPNFCKEYEKYWNHDETCRFKTPLEIAQYIDMYDIPVQLYFNFTDTPVNNMAEVYAYFIREYAGISYDEDGHLRSDYQHGLDGEEEQNKAYTVQKVEDK